MTSHIIEDISFSELWCRCSCGILLESPSQEQMPRDWQSHRTNVQAVMDKDRTQASVSVWNRKSKR